MYLSFVLAYMVQVSIGVGEIIMTFSKYYAFWSLVFFLSIIIAVVSNLILIPKYGMEGAAGRAHYSRV